MTDKQLYAKRWLNRLNDYELLLQAERRTLEVLETRLYKGVSCYEITGQCDRITANAKNDNNLYDYSNQVSRVEKAQAYYLSELAKVRGVLEQLPDELKPLAIDRYINGLKWEKLAELYKYSDAQIYRKNTAILNRVAQILAPDPIELQIVREEFAAV